jgi:hypothetical protein
MSDQVSRCLFDGSSLDDKVMDYCDGLTWDRRSPTTSLRKSLECYNYRAQNETPPVCSVRSLLVAY